MLKSALEHAVREEEIPRNVARNVRTGTPRPRRFEPLTADEARKFLAAANGHRLQPLFELALHTGLRKGELLRLRWEDLDLASGTASIRRTLQRTNSGGLTPSRPRPRAPNDASPCPRHACTPSNSTATDSARNARRRGRARRTAATSSPDPTAPRSQGPPSPGTSTPRSTGHSSAVSGSTLSATRRPPSSWSRAWSSS
ncbi:tyrosine-type recombinase/integrase [Streptomyces luteogriseus]|uniref:tyrosine-type recombinase/integrase n=1 Tax=Streptomyces luteogriseus TaxID=68233 RepID=UPI003AF3CBFA